MGNKISTIHLCKKLKELSKQGTALLLVFALALPLNLFAQNSPDGRAQPPETRDFNFSVINAETLKRMGLEPGSVQTIQTSGIHQGRKVSMEIIRGTVPAESANVIVDIIEKLEPQIRKAAELDPNIKFDFRYLAPESEKAINPTALELYDILKDIKATNFVEERIPDSLAQEYKELLKGFVEGSKNLFNETTKNEVSFSFVRMFGAGGLSYASFHYGLNIPIPAALSMGFVMGSMSGSVGLLLQKFTRWLVSNTVTPQNTRRYTRIGSVETYALLSPILIPLQSTVWNTPEGVGIIAGGAAASVIVQNVYYTIKKGSPTAAMWYKWFAVEAAFLTAAGLLLPAFGLPTEAPWLAIKAIFITSLASTASQGVWDIFITDSLRRIPLEEAIKRDIQDLSRRISKTVVTDEKFKEIVLEEKQNVDQERAVRNRYNWHFTIASLVSVGSAVAMSVGSNTGNNPLYFTGKAGLITLGASGALTWSYAIFKEKGGFSGISSRLKAYYQRFRNSVPNIDTKTSSQKFSDTVVTHLGVNSCRALFSK